MGHLVCRAQVTCVLYDGPQTHMTQQPIGMVPKALKKLIKGKMKLKFGVLSFLF